MSDSPAASPISLGLDLGTSAVKVVALDAAGALIAERGAAFATASDRPLQAEQAPADWLEAAGVAMQALHAAMIRARGPVWAAQVTAIGLTGQLPTLVCVSDAGPVAPAITWKDGRADEWAATRVDAARRAAMYARTGMPIDGRYLAPMLQFHFTGRLAGLRRVLSAKDYLLSVLTGRDLTEPSTAAGYGLYDLQERRFSPALGEFWAFPAQLLPEIRPANSPAGPLTAAGAQLLGLPAGIPVSTGAADSVCAAYAMSGLDPRVVSISFGSSAVIVGCCGDARLDPKARHLVTPHVADGWFGREMDLLATGTGYRWLTELFEWGEGRIDAEAARSVPGANGLRFPPYLAGGEQGALWNPRLQGALFGLTVRHTRADIARAFLEGVFFEIRRCVDVLAETTPVEAVTVSGNLVASPTTL
jgi:xylulokinase